MSETSDTVTWEWVQADPDTWELKRWASDQPPTVLNVVRRDTNHFGLKFAPVDTGSRALVTSTWSALVLATEAAFQRTSEKPARVVFPGDVVDPDAQRPHRRRRPVVKVDLNIHGRDDGGAAA